MIGVFRNVTSCMPLASNVVDLILILERHVMPWGATNVIEKVALIDGWQMRVIEDEASVYAIRRTLETRCLNPSVN